MPPDSARWTILDVMQWAAKYFTSHDVESPRLSSELLLAHVLGLNRLDLYLDYDRPLEADELAALRSLIKRRAGGEPVAYIVGEKDFWEASFEVCRHVLIPRPDTETLVESALEGLESLTGQNLSGTGEATVWEPATGSGAVVLSLAARLPEVRFVASDISPAALEVARRNAARQGLLDRVSFWAADWTAGLRPGRAVFDMIVANPPYVSTGELSQLAPDIRGYEPAIALDGGEDGLTQVRRLVYSAADFLSPRGLLLLEIGWDQKEAVAGLARETGSYATVDFVRDLAGHDRVARLRKKSAPTS